MIAYFFGQLFGVLLLVGFVVALRVLADAIARFHDRGMTRVRGGRR